MNLRAELEARLTAALEAAGAAPGTPAMVAPAARPQFGDYQANGVMGAAKALRINPRQLAAKVAAAADLADLAEPPEVAGPGFINIRLKAEWLAAELSRRAADERFGARPAEPPQTVVVDYSAPNLAKEMHVGHLRSTIIGDALARTLDFLGHRVIRQNHVGDWGTQFGMLIAYMEEQGAAAAGGLSDLEEFYRQAKRRFDEDAAFADAARRAVVRLQGGDTAVRATWRRFVGESVRHARHIYDRMGVTLRDEHVRGESAYNDDLPKVVEELRAAGLLTESEGAQCVFLEEFRGKDDKLLPLIVQKSDEGYLYATSDLAAIRFRCCKGKAGGKVDWLADRILYVVDARQSLHFQQVFAVARKAGFAFRCGDRDRPVALEHVGFGVMMGADGRPFRTREGGTVKLADLLDEAERRALELVSDKSGDLPEDRRREIARIVGIGAVKYADLSQNRASDYVFSWDKMLSLDGNTAPYMQYAYARVRSIFRRGQDTADRELRIADCRIALAAPPERSLAVQLARFPETVEAVARECLPNLLCAYLYDLAGAFMVFYENCPVLKADDATRASRLALCDLTARTIRKGLELLGIETVERM